MAGIEGNLDEEHRLAFVAASRAKEQLVISYPIQPLHGAEQMLSRYFQK
jgi:superfamily I DNA/RNA helicase